MVKQINYRLFLAEDLDGSLRDSGTLTPAGQNDPQALANSGCWLSTIGRLEEAEDLLSEAERLAPDDDAISYNLVLVKMKRHKFDEAIGVARRAQVSSDLRPLYDLQMGTCLLALSRYPEAVPLLRAAVSKMPTNKEAWFNFSKAATAAGLATLGAEAWQRYLKLRRRTSAHGWRNASSPPNRSH